MSNVRKALLSGFKTIENHIIHAIDALPKKPWTVDPKTKVGYGQRLYHLIEALEFYGAEDPKTMDWGHLIQMPKNIPENEWGEIFKKQSEKYLSEDIFKNYLAEIMTKLETRLSELTDEEIFGKDQFLWFENRLAKYLYVQRHTLWHLGELSLWLRTNDLPPLSWS